MFKLHNYNKEENNVIKDNIGYIHSVESFGSVDGPGIRYVIFFQGCILKCQYCHNRDTWAFGIGNKYTAQELVDQILKYTPYFKTSGGGVTFSGGEPLMQQNFLIETMTLLKKHNIHIAIDTSGAFLLNKKIDKIIELADLFLLDIKHIDNAKCIELTGKTNRDTFDFLKYLNLKNKKVWIRQIIVPGITDDEEDLKKLKKFLKQFNNIENIELLAYQTFGVHKWKELGLKYPLEGVREANKDDILRARKILGLKQNEQSYWYIAN